MLPSILYAVFIDSLIPYYFCIWTFSEIKLLFSHPADMCYTFLFLGQYVHHSLHRGHPPTSSHHVKILLFVTQIILVDHDAFYFLTLMFLVCIPCHKALLLVPRHCNMFYNKMFLYFYIYYYFTLVASFYTLILHF